MLSAQCLDGYTLIKYVLIITTFSVNVIYRAEKELDALIIASQMESNFDIDKILNDKAKKRKFTKTNVKNLIKVLCTYIYVQLYNLFNLLIFFYKNGLS